MRTILVTGSDGFIGKHLVQALAARPDIAILTYDVKDERADLDRHLSAADAVCHLAGVNRPESEEAFDIGNAQLTEHLVSVLSQRSEKPLLLLSSSTQAALDNPYGRSKKKAEEALERYGNAGGSAAIFRLPNVFGKWSRPNYNSAVATFCHSIARGLEVTISDPGRVLELVYVDDVVNAFLAVLDKPEGAGTRRLSATPVSRITLADLVEKLRAIHEVRTSLRLPDMTTSFDRQLYATYLSFLPADGFSYRLVRRDDNRGALAEFLKGPAFGQVFVSRTKPGIVRGNHYHNTKAEKFLVLEGKAIIRFRSVIGDTTASYEVRGEDLAVVDIPPGFTHSIENVGTGELVVLFWSCEVFDPAAPDTHAMNAVEHTKREDAE